MARHAIRIAATSPAFDAIPSLFLRLQSQPPTLFCRTGSSGVSACLSTFELERQTSATRPPFGARPSSVGRCGGGRDPRAGGAREHGQHAARSSGQRCGGRTPRTRGTLAAPETSVARGTNRPSRAAAGQAGAKVMRERKERIPLTVFSTWLFVDNRAFV